MTFSSLAFAGAVAGMRGVELGFLLRRIGFLGPDPPHLAVWAAATYRDIEELVRDHEDDSVMRRITTGVYREFGRAAA
jgi:hypothetical protein